MALMQPRMQAVDGWYRTVKVEKPASDLPEIRHQAFVNALCFPHEKVEFAEYVRYT